MFPVILNIDPRLWSQTRVVENPIGITHQLLRAIDQSIGEVRALDIGPTQVTASQHSPRQDCIAQVGLVDHRTVL